MKKIDINLDGMSCYISEDRIKTGLAYLDGVISSESNCVNQQVSCEYDENITSKEEIIKRLEEMEFKVKEKPQS